LIRGGLEKKPMNLQTSWVRGRGFKIGGGASESKTTGHSTSNRSKEKGKIKNTKGGEKKKERW